MDETVNIEKTTVSNEENNVVSRNQSSQHFLHDKSKVYPSCNTDVTTRTPKDRLENIRNLPNFQNVLVGMNNDLLMEPPKAKRSRLSPTNISVNMSELNDNQEIGKRRRVQHDYRRLSSSGYLDDYETNRERRFSSDSDAPSNSPSPNKSKVTTPPVVANESDDPGFPHVKLTLKFSKTENGTFINGSGKYRGFLYSQSFHILNVKRLIWIPFCYRTLQLCLHHQTFARS